jgi:hypothetical protein
MLRGRDGLVSGVLTAGLSVGLLVAIAACGDSGDAVAQKPGAQGTPGNTGTPGAGAGLPAGCTPQSAVAICLTFDFTGSTTLKGSFWAYAAVQDPELPDSTCAEYGASMLKSTEVGIPMVSKVIGSKLIETQFDTAWPPAKPGIVDNPATGSIRIDDVAYEARNSNTTGKLELQPDGSGKYTLNKLVHTDGGDTDVSGSISGTLSWTCMEGKN